MTEPPVVESFVAWARSRPDVLAAALVGSHARGDAGPGSDVDLLTIAADPSALVFDPAWVETFGPVEHVATERWGALTSLRVSYEGGLEVELGIAGPDWAATDPVDPGTARVVVDGMRILHDPEGLLARLQQS